LFYIREAVGLPTIKAQKAALALDWIADDDPVWIDLNPKRKRATLAEPFPELALAIRELRPEDELAVSGPEVLGGSQAQIFQVMQAIGAKQAAIYDASTDQVIDWQPEALKALDFAARGETKRREFALRKARVRRAELGRGNGRVAQLDKEKNPRAFKAALAVWLDPELTGNQAAEKIGVSPSTAYRKLGSRDQPIFGRKTSK
jgi:hypothetical protein